MKKKTYPLMHAGKKQQFARSVVVGDLVFLSGMSGKVLETGEMSPENLVEQVKVALDKVRAALTEAGTSMDNIVKTVILLKNIEDYGTMRQVEKEYWQKYAPRLIEEPPASTLMQVASLGKPNMLVAVDVVALIPH